VKKVLVLVPCLMLSACLGSNQPDIGLAPPPKMPVLPAALAKKAEPLPALTGTTLADREKELAATEQQYNEKGTQLNAVIDAYLCVKSSLDNRTDPAKCFGL
jgi:hypothetical protein